MAEHNEVGKQGEVIAVKYLAKKGYNIITQNWRFQKAEIDIIAKYENQIVIVEVKTEEKLFDRTFTFNPYSIKEKNVVFIDLMGQDCVLAV